MNFFDDLETIQFSKLDCETLNELEQVADERIIDTRKEPDVKRSTYVISEHFTNVYDSVKHVLQYYGKELRVQYALIQIDDRRNNSDNIFLKLYLNFSDKDRKYLSDMRAKFSSCTVNPTDIEIRDFRKFGLTLKGRDPQRNKWFDKNPLVDIYKYLLPRVDKYFKSISESFDGLSNISQADSPSFADSIPSFPTVIQPNYIVKLKRHYEDQIKNMQQQIIQLQYQIQSSVFRRGSTADNSIFSSIRREESKEERTAHNIEDESLSEEEDSPTNSDQAFINDNDESQHTEVVLPIQSQGEIQLPPQEIQVPPQVHPAIRPQGSLFGHIVSRSLTSLRGLAERFERPVSKKLKTELLTNNSDRV